MVAMSTHLFPIYLLFVYHRFVRNTFLILETTFGIPMYILVQKMCILAPRCSSVSAFVLLFLCYFFLSVSFLASFVFSLLFFFFFEGRGGGDLGFGGCFLCCLFLRVFCFALFRLGFFFGGGGGREAFFVCLVWIFDLFCFCVGVGFSFFPSFCLSFSFSLYLSFLSFILSSFS